MIESLFYYFLKNHLNDVELLVVADDKEAQKAAWVAKLLGKTPFVLSDFRARRGDDLRSYHEEFFALLVALRQYNRSLSSHKILIAPFNALIYPLPKQELLEGISIALGQTLDLKALCDRLHRYGYEFVDMIEMQGEVSLRGDMLDIYPPSTQKPLRISFFDNEIESIRYFDVLTQISNKEDLQGVEIPPALFALREDEYAQMMDGITNSDYLSFSKDMLSLGFWYLPMSSLSFVHTGKKVVVSVQAQENMEAEKSILDEKKYAQERDILEVLCAYPLLESVQGCQDFHISLNHLNTFLELHSKKKITIIARNDVLLRQYQIDHDLYRIVHAPYELNFFTPDELFVSLNKPIIQKKKKHSKPRIMLDEMNVGDYVVHRDYGVAIFQGISQEKVLGAKRDFILLAYQGEDRLLLPVENLDAIDRYISDGGSVPSVDQLGSSSFAKLKEKVKKRLLEIAEEIVALAAKRDVMKGSVLDTLSEEIAIFQAQSGFEYTADQQRAIEEIFLDVSSGKVMDRLLSGDVGFGKTEIAMNAIFVAYKSGFQSAMLVPTTLLALQHFNTLKERLSPFGMRVAKVDRFLTAKEKTRLLLDVQEGRIDVVVGTHTLLGTSFKCLGLIIVDEEHKFGVKQKEKIKQLAHNVHILTMSATPIPRTLNQALSDIKALSTLMTPPHQRMPVRTFVKTHSSSLIKEAILREMRRGGQVFYIHNNIASIKTIKEELEALIPHLKIAILHSQIPLKESENIMIDFAQSQYHVLLSTSIVESGIHLPNANTILINSSDRFGMADLHQLRGRVGRGGVEGFCYFLIQDPETLTQEAKKRLLALETHADLGSGSILAYHDLEIRGGGNLLGEAQSGHIKNIGYALYLKMLEDAICSLSKQGSDVKDHDVDIKLSVNAFLSPTHISSDRLRLNLYRRLSLCEEVDEIHQIELEVHDRFGTFDRYTQQFFALITIKVLAKQLKIHKITNFNQKITFVDADGAMITIEANSKDDDDVLEAILKHLHRQREAS